MPCKACGKGTLSNPRDIAQTPLSAAEIRDRMPRKPVRRVQRIDQSAPRRAS